MEWLSDARGWWWWVAETLEMKGRLKMVVGILSLKIEGDCDRWWLCPWICVAWGLRSSVILSCCCRFRHLCRQWSPIVGYAVIVGLTFMKFTFMPFTFPALNRQLKFINRLNDNNSWLLKPPLCHWINTWYLSRLYYAAICTLAIVCFVIESKIILIINFKPDNIF